MLFSLLYLILRRALGTGRRPQDERDIELLVLRHQVAPVQPPTFDGETSWAG